MQISLKLVPKGPTDNKVGNFLVPNRQQAITWANTDLVHGHMYAVPEEMS